MTLDEAPNIVLPRPLVFVRPILVLGNYSGADTSYQLVAEYTVNDGYIGYIEEISMIGDIYANLAGLIVDIGQTRHIDQKTIQSGMTARWDGGVELPPLAETKIYVVTTGVALKFDVMITGREQMNRHGQT